MSFISISYEILHPDEGNGKTRQYIREGFSVELSALMSKFEDSHPWIEQLRSERKNLGTTNPYALAHLMRAFDRKTYKKMEKKLIKQEE